MDWPEWAPLYARILADFGFPREKDEEARDVLDALLADRTLAAPEDLRSRIEGEVATVYGPAEIAEDWRYAGRHGVTICADSAITTLASRGVAPDVIVTDLDGDVWQQAEANRRGAIVLVHAHGDNIPKLREWVPRFHGKVMGTCQCEPRGRVLNFGGFTDGDRACFLADHFRAREILLVGFDFERPALGPGKDAERKRKKLAWAKGLIAGLGTPVRAASERVA